MPFTEKEWIHLLRAEGFTDVVISERINAAEKTVRIVKSRKETGKASRYHDSICALGRENIDMPWSDECLRQVQEMRGLISKGYWKQIDNAYAFSGHASIHAALAVDPDSEVTVAEWDHVLVAYFYLLAMQQSKFSIHEKHRERWPLVSAILMSLVVRRNDKWADLLKFKISGNTFVYAWSRKPRHLRNSSEMREVLRQSRYMENLSAYNILMPYDVVAPFNALAIASRLELRDLYEELLAKLVVADARFADPAKVPDNEFDDDFDDFMQWFNGNNASSHNEKNLPNETGKSNDAKIG